MRNVVLALFTLIVVCSSGCGAPQIALEDVQWPSDSELVEMNVPSQLPQGWERVPFFPPIADPLVPPFQENLDVYIAGYNRNNVPTFTHRTLQREDLVWALTHKNEETGKEEVDEMQVYSFPIGTIDRLRRGEMPAEDFSVAIFQKTDNVWHRLDHEQLTRRHVRTHLPQVTTWPILRSLFTSEPTYMQAYCYPQGLVETNNTSQTAAPALTSAVFLDNWPYRPR